MTKRRPQSEERSGIDPIIERATRWFVTLHDDPADAAMRPEFEAWRDADPRHAAAYERLQRLWGASGHLPSIVAAEPQVDRRSVLRGAGGIALGTAALVGGGRLLLGAHPFADHRTGAGERRTIMLADGSHAELSAATALSVDFSGDRRLIRLHEGEAWFQVARDPARPFMVDAAGGVTTALGTAFAVMLEGGGARVSVTEHAVRVAANAAPVKVREGQSLRYGQNGPGRVEEADPSALAWRFGRLAFVNRPLGEVVAALDRWSSSRTIIMDGALSERRVTLMIATDDAHLGLAKLGAAVPMRITQIAGLLTIVRNP